MDHHPMLGALRMHAWPDYTAWVCLDLPSGLHYRIIAKLGDEEFWALRKDRTSLQLRLAKDKAEVAFGPFTTFTLAATTLLLDS